MFDFERGELLLINKPIGWTSFDVVNRIKKLIKKYTGKSVKVGHAGTLDPLARGLLIVATGKMTKQISLYQNLDKGYSTIIYFGATTPSYDAATEINQTFPYEHITQNLLAEVLREKFLGEQWQMPPEYSAKRINGRRAYELARKGIKPELKPVKINIKEIEIIDHRLPKCVTLRMVVSKGTYIRAVARDLGKALNSGAYVKFLMREMIGDFYLSDAITIEQFEVLISQQYKNDA